MNKWEYKIEEGYVGNMPFQEWGQEGWEMCGILNQLDLGGGIRFYFKRSIDSVSL